jgi:hypothetical protein
MPLPWRHLPQLLALAVLPLSCGHRSSLHTLAPPADGSAPDAADAVARPDVSPDTLPDAGCGSWIAFRVEPDPAVDPTTLCPVDCGGPLATLASGTVQYEAGYWLSLGTPVVWADAPQVNSCALSCDTCKVIFCHSCVVSTIFPAGGVFHPVWDGSYYLQGTCNGNACMGGKACAPPGRYTATFCIPKGVPSQAGGASSSIPLSLMDGATMQAKACGSADFDLPEAASPVVKIGGPLLRVPRDYIFASALQAVTGNYVFTPSSGSIAGPNGPAKRGLAGGPLTINPGTDSDLQIVVNPLPDDFPDLCTIPVNAFADRNGNWSLQNPATTCTSGNAVVTLYPGYYYVSLSGDILVISAGGNSTGGSLSADQTLAFAYSGTAARAP